MEKSGKKRIGETVYCGVRIRSMVSNMLTRSVGEAQNSGSNTEKEVKQV